MHPSVVCAGAIATALPGCASTAETVERFARLSLELTRYDSAQVDLNADGTPEHILLAKDPDFCGTGGCTLFVLTETDDGIKEVGRIPAVQAPIRLSPQDNLGWQNLLFVARFDATSHYHGTLFFEDGAYRKHVSDVRVDWDDPIKGEVLIGR